MNRSIEVLSNKPQLVNRSLELVLAQVQAAIAQRGVCTIALAGGSTPKPLYEKLAVQDLPWDQLQIFWGDERYVPPSDPDSNEGMARQAWLDHVPIPASHVHPMPTQSADPKEAAQDYDQHLQNHFGVQPGEFPALDLILLGLGPDGHTASLFPYTAALEVSDRLITVGQKDGQPRLTFTVPFINHARCVVFMVSGENKRPALSEIFAPEGDANKYPARRINPVGQLIWLLDSEAGEGLVS